MSKSLHDSPSVGPLGATVVVTVVVSVGASGGTGAVGRGTGAGGGGGDGVVDGVVTGAVGGGDAVWRERDSWMPTKMSDPISVSATTAAMAVAGRVQDGVPRTGSDVGEVVGEALTDAATVMPTSVPWSLIEAPALPLKALAN